VFIVNHSGFAETIRVFNAGKSTISKDLESKMSTSDHQLKLIVDRQFLSPYAMSVFVTLLEKGIPFHIEPIDLNSHHNLQPPYRDDSLTARIPAIEHNNFWLSESTAIIEYLEEVFPAPEYPSVFPQQRLERARARQI
jgi:glutathione S-transferase